MALTVKVRRGGRGLVISLPKQLAALMEIEAGDVVALEDVDVRGGVLRLRRLPRAGRGAVGAALPATATGATALNSVAARTRT